MRVRVVDLEATGTDKDKAKGIPVGICEIGYTDVFADGRIEYPQSHLVNPKIRMPASARGVHHISDEMLADAISPDVAFGILMADMEPGDMFAAHNSKFERTFFGGGAHEWICTFQCAKHLVEDAPDFKNQTLRYHLDLDPEFEWPDMAMPPHRAGPDSYVTAHLFRSLRAIAGSSQELVRFTHLPVLLKTVPFGKYQGELWSSMDRGFLEWILTKDFGPDVKDTARHWLNVLGELRIDPFA